jgi:hypothetical protein
MLLISGECYGHWNSRVRAKVGGSKDYISEEEFRGILRLFRESVASFSKPRSDVTWGGCAIGKQV